jgi:hypothetical protein
LQLRMHQAFVRPATTKNFPLMSADSKAQWIAGEAAWASSLHRRSPAMAKHSCTRRQTAVQQMHIPTEVVAVPPAFEPGKPNRSYWGQTSSGFAMARRHAACICYGVMSSRQALKALVVLDVPRCRRYSGTDASVRSSMLPTPESVTSLAHYPGPGRVVTPAQSRSSKGPCITAARTAAASEGCSPDPA